MPWSGQQQLEEALQAVITARTPVSASRIKAVASAAARCTEHAQEAVAVIESFVERADAEHKLYGLYSVHAVCKRFAESRDGPSKELFGLFFSERLPQVVEGVFRGGNSSHEPQLLKLLGLWISGSFFSDDAVSQLKRIQKQAEEGRLVRIDPSSAVALTPPRDTEPPLATSALADAEIQLQQLMAGQHPQVIAQLLETAMKAGGGAAPGFAGDLSALQAQLGADWVVPTGAEPSVAVHAAQAVPEEKPPSREEKMAQWTARLRSAQQQAQQELGPGPALHLPAAAPPRQHPVHPPAARAEFNEPNAPPALPTPREHAAPVILAGEVDSPPSSSRRGKWDSPPRSAAGAASVSSVSGERDRARGAPAARMEFSTTLYIGPLPPEVQIEMLISDAFSRFGEVRGIRILPQKSCAFVAMATREQAERVVADMRPQDLGASRVGWARSISSMPGQRITDFDAETGRMIVVGPSEVPDSGTGRDSRDRWSSESHGSELRSAAPQAGTGRRERPSRWDSAEPEDRSSSKRRRTDLPIREDPAGQRGARDDCDRSAEVDAWLRDELGIPAPEVARKPEGRGDVAPPAERNEGNGGGNSRRTLFVGGLTSDMSDRDIWEALGGAHVGLKRVFLPPNRTTGAHRGFGYVDMADAGAAAELVASLPRGFEVRGHRLRLEFAKTDMA